MPVARPNRPNWIVFAIKRAARVSGGNGAPQQAHTTPSQIASASRRPRSRGRGRRL
jgi:hypothetical protein